MFGYGLYALGVTFTYTIVSLAAVTSITPDLGDTSGGDLHTIVGTGFTGATDVRIGGTTAIGFSVISDTEIIVIIPAHVAATGQSVEVNNVAWSAANTLFEFWSPAELSPTAYWDRGNYQDVTAGTWPPAVVSLPELVQATAAYQPTEVMLEPDFDGTDDLLSCASNLVDLVSLAAGTMVVMFAADSALPRTALPSGGYADPALIGDTNYDTWLKFTQDGVTALAYPGAYVEVTATCPADGSLHLAVMRWDSINLGLTLDGAAETTTSCAELTTMTGTVQVGKGYEAADFFDGRIRMILTMNTTISSANITKLTKWAQACRGLES